jgi:hypothetical protein
MAKRRKMGLHGSVAHHRMMAEAQIAEADEIAREAHSLANSGSCQRALKTLIEAVDYYGSAITHGAEGSMNPKGLGDANSSIAFARETFSRKCMVKGALDGMRRRRSRR